ncbi:MULTISPECIES: hypothetical protein [Oerskovia]|uniref:Uncharacterized protein n=2 Tax=Oerskovia TaxID=162491 RepID=A0ABR8V1G7_9CELL|nr:MULTISPECIES: hypothetical protein [Oerskovia]MBD7998520.1 hypothetical protein [Oerskovia gallyi]MBM7498973.1 hypothetical protein [Oerskovia paurometabola]
MSGLTLAASVDAAVYVPTGSGPANWFLLFGIVLVASIIVFMVVELVRAAHDRRLPPHRRLSH